MGFTKIFMYYLKAIQMIFNELRQGNYLRYFLPGTIASLLFYWLFSYVHGTANSVSTFADVWNFIISQVYVFFLLTLLSPVNCRLSQKLDTHLTGTGYSAGIVEIFSDFGRMVLIVTVSLILELVFMLVWWIFSYFIGTQFIVDLGYFSIAAFFFGFSFFDYSLERHRVGLFTSLAEAFKKPLTMILTGSIFSLLYMIPVIGIILAPVISTMISTIVYLYTVKKIS